MNLTEEGQWPFVSYFYRWWEAQVEVRSPDPFVRFFEDRFQRPPEDLSAAGVGTGQI